MQSSRHLEPPGLNFRWLASQPLSPMKKRALSWLHVTSRPASRPKKVCCWQPAFFRLRGKASWSQRPAVPFLMSTMPSPASQVIAGVRSSAKTLVCSVRADKVLTTTKACGVVSWSKVIGMAKSGTVEKMVRFMPKCKPSALCATTRVSRSATWHCFPTSPRTRSTRASLST